MVAPRDQPGGEIRGVAQRVERELRRVGTPERAAGGKRYLKSDLAFLGATLGDIRRVVRANTNRTLGHDDLLRLQGELWSKGVFDLRMAACMLLKIHAAQFDRNDLDVIELLIRDSKTWALVDVLAGDVVGEIALHHRLKRRLDTWAKDDDFWIRRSSLLAELKPLKSGLDFEPFAKRADRLLDEKEFFIRKAIGWVLREASKKRPDEVFEWIASRTHRASGVTMREVVKHLDARRADQLMRAHKENRPVAT